MWNVKTDTSNNIGSWNHLKIIKKIPEQHKARNQGTTKKIKRAILGTSHTAESTDVEVHNI